MNDSDHCIRNPIAIVFLLNSIKLGAFDKKGCDIGV